MKSPYLTTALLQLQLGKEDDRIKREEQRNVTIWEEDSEFVVKVRP